MKRRADGEGAIYQEPDGRWRGVLVVGWAPAPGTRRGVKPIRKKVSGGSKREVAAKLRALQSAQDAGQEITAREPTAAAWLEHWLEQVARPTIRDSTYQGYRVAVTRWTAHLGGRVKLDTLRPEHLEDLYARMRAEGHSERNIRLHHAVIHRALVVAQRRRRVRSNVAGLVELPAAVPFRAQTMTQEQVWAFLDVAMRRRQPARWLFAVLMAWRQGEVLGLTWDRVDLAAGTVRRELKLGRVRRGGLQLGRLKGRGGAGEATLPLPETLAQLLATQRTEQRRARIQLGPAWVGAQLPVDGGPPEPVDLVFSRVHGQAMSREDDWAEWHAILAEAGIPPMRPHDARHSAGTFLAALGVHPRVAQAILGHGDPTLTMRVYTHVPDGAVRAALTQMDELLTRRGSSTGSNTGRSGAAPSGA